jgi:hypothetical protein
MNLLVRHRMLSIVFATALLAPSASAQRRFT